MNIRLNLLKISNFHEFQTNFLYLQAYLMNWTIFLLTLVIGSSSATFRRKDDTTAYTQMCVAPRVTGAYLRGLTTKCGQEQSLECETYGGNVNPMVNCKTNGDADKNYNFRLCCQGGKDEEKPSNLKWMDCRGDNDEASKATKGCGEKMELTCDDEGYKGEPRCKVYGSFLERKFNTCCFEDYGITTYPWGNEEVRPSYGI